MYCFCLIFSRFQTILLKKKMKQKTFHGDEMNSYKCLVQKIIFLFLIFWLLIQCLFWIAARIHKKPHYFMIVIYLIIFQHQERMPPVSIVCWHIFQFFKLARKGYFHVSIFIMSHQEKYWENHFNLNQSTHITLWKRYSYSEWIDFIFQD